MFINKSQKRSHHLKLLLLKLIKTFPGRMIDDYAFKLNATHRTTERYLKDLKQAGKIERKGSFKTGGYYVVE